MRINHKLGSLKILNQHLNLYPTPLNLNYAFNFGSLAGIVLMVQIITGILLAMHYTAHVDHAFSSVVHLMNDVPSGMILRYTHANGASLFFTVVYLHTFRGIYYSSGNQPRELVWITGVIILLVMIITAFIGYYISQKWVYLHTMLLESNVELSKAFTSVNLSVIYIRSKDDEKKAVSPVKSYYNLHNLDTQLSILKDNKRKAGIYLVLNNKNGNAYIGSAINNRIYARFRNHCIHLKNTNIALSRAIRKYGLENFSFHILEYFAGIIEKENCKKAHLSLLERETFFLKEYMPMYNIILSGVSSLGYKHTEQTKIKMRTNYSVERKVLVAKLNKGKTLNDSAKALLSKKALERYQNAAFKKEFLLKNKDTLFKGKSVILYGLASSSTGSSADNNILSKYKSITEASVAFSCDRKTISKYLNNPNKLFKGLGYLKSQ